MILATDTYYRQNSAIVAGVLFTHWSDAAPAAETCVRVTDTREYVPGKFYKRELPCILALLKRLGASPFSIVPDIIIIDGFVHLSRRMEPALGSHLYGALGGKTPVVGVAKNPVKDTPAEYALCRGSSRRPLYVSAAGMELQEAKRHIAQMHGKFRMPALLKRADQLSRAAARTTARRDDTDYEFDEPPVFFHEP